MSALWSGRRPEMARHDGRVSVPERSQAGARPMREVARQRVRYGLTTWFRTPPRRHGEVSYTREVGFLELFYDLVYVVLIGRATHHLAEHVDWAGVGDFAVACRTNSARGSRDGSTSTCRSPWRSPPAVPRWSASSTTQTTAARPRPQRGS